MAHVGGIIASAILGVVSKQIMSAIKGQIKLQWNFVSDLQKMRPSLETVEALLKDAEKQSITELTVRLWLGRLKDAMYEISDMIDDFEANTEPAAQKEETETSHADAPEQQHTSRRRTQSTGFEELLAGLPNSPAPRKRPAEETPPSSGDSTASKLPPLKINPEAQEKRRKTGGSTAAPTAQEPETAKPDSPAPYVEPTEARKNAPADTPQPLSRLMMTWPLLSPTLQQPSKIQLIQKLLSLGRVIILLNPMC